MEDLHLDKEGKIELVEILFSNNRIVIPFKKNWLSFQGVLELEGITSIDLNVIYELKDEDVLKYFFYPADKATAGTLKIADFLGDDKYMLSKYTQYKLGNVHMIPFYIAEKMDILKENGFKTVKGSYLICPDDLNELGKHFNNHRAYKLKNGKNLNLLNFRSVEREHIKVFMKGYDSVSIKIKNINITENELGEEEDRSEYETKIFDNPIHFLSFLNFLNPNKKGLYIGKIKWKDKRSVLHVKYDISKDYTEIQDLRYAVL